MNPTTIITSNKPVVIIVASEATEQPANPTNQCSIM
jgi:hypothetical protein